MFYDLVSVRSDEKTRARYYDVFAVDAPLDDGTPITTDRSLILFEDIDWKGLREKLIPIIKDGVDKGPLFVRSVVDGNIKFVESGESYLDFESFRDTFPRSPGLVIGGD